MRLIIIALFIGSIFSVQASQEVHFLHWWTSQGEVKSVGLVKHALEQAGFDMVNVPVQGGGGNTAKPILQARAIAGNPPDMAQLEGPAIKSWAALGFLHSLDTVADNNHWDEHLLPLVRDIHQHQGEYVAVPLTIHRLNWMWVNHGLLNQYQLKVPQTWDQIIEVFGLLKQRGIAPLAMGNEPWQVVQLFENIAFGIGGANYYRRALIDLDPEALDSPLTLEALHKFRQISLIVMPDLSRQRWEEATQNLLSGQRAFQITGDWVGGELMASEGKMPATISCYPLPAKQPGFIYNIDSLALFRSPLLNDERANQIAGVVASAEFQHGFNKAKGAIPPRRDIPLTGYNTCSLQAREDFYAAEQQGTLVPSMIDSMAVSPIIQKAASIELFRFFNDPSVTSEDVILHMKTMGTSGIALQPKGRRPR